MSRFTNQGRDSRRRRRILSLIVVAAISGPAAYAATDAVTGNQTAGVPASDCPAVAEFAGTDLAADSYYPRCPTEAELREFADRASVIGGDRIDSMCADLATRNQSHALCDSITARVDR